MIPQVTQPLAKAIRTSEGVLVWLINVALAVGTLVDPSKLPPKEAAIVGSALTAVHVASRTLLKVVAVQQNVGIAAPETVDVPAEVKKIIEQAGLVSDSRFNEIGHVLNTGMNSLNAILAGHIRAIAAKLEQAGNRPLSGVEQAVSKAGQAAQPLAVVQERSPGPPNPPEPPDERPVG